MSKKNNLIKKETLVELTKKYQVTSNGTKRDLAERLWVVSGESMCANDLKKIVNLLSDDNKKKVIEEIRKQIEEPVTDYKGLWYSQPKSLYKMSRNELLKHLRKFRDSYEKITNRNQDLKDEHLEVENNKQLIDHLKWYFSIQAKIQAEKWLR